MSYSVENINGCTKKFLFNFDSVDLSSEIKSALLQKQKTSNMKGFRKGKAPLEMLEKVYGPEVENEALRKFISNRLIEAIDKEELKPVGYPSFTNTKYEAGKNVSFEAIVEIFPEFEVKGVESISLKREDASVSEEEVEQVKKNILSSKAEIVELKDENVELKEGHLAVINFQGKLENGESPEKLKAEEFLVDLGAKGLLPEFEQGLVGMKKNEKKVISVTFPDEYHEDDLRNAKVQFEVEVLEIKERKLPDFSDELIKELGFESVDDFQTKTRERLFKQKERQIKENLHQQVLEKLVSENPLDIPSALVFQQEKALKEDVMGTLKNQGVGEQGIETYFSRWEEDIKKRAKFQVSSSLILDRLAKDFEISTDEKDLESKFEEIGKGMNLSLEEVKKRFGKNDQIKKNLMFAIREEKTFEKILERVQFS